MGDREEQPTTPPSAEGDDFALEAGPLDPPRAALARLGRLRGARGRALTLAATALLVVVVAVGLFAHATRDPGAAVATLLRLPTPTPIAPMPLSAGVVYFSNGAPWGTLTLDGARLPDADLTGYGIAVKRGAHHLVYQARYFPTLRCVFSAPRAISDTCPLDTSDAAIQYLRGQALARVINLGSTGATLRADQRAALTQLADQLLASQSLTAAIAPGDAYLDSAEHIVTASAPLHFTLTLALDSSQVAGSMGICYQFCPDPSFSTGGLPVGAGWPTRLTVTAYWAITDASGRRLTGPDYQAGQSYPSSIPVIVGVRLTPGGWQINDLEGLSHQAITNAAADLAYAAVNSAGGGGYATSFLMGPNPLDGCIMDIAFNGQTSRLFWRFGALVAIDEAAHHVFAQFPVATPTEQSLAAAIAQAAQSTP